MPKVRILVGISGADVSYIKGDEVDLPGPTASAWCEAGMAELVRGEQPETPERIRVEPETTTRARPSGRRKPS